MEKKPFYFGIAGFVGLLVLSILFCKERMIFSDAAFYLFNIVKDGNFAFFHSRYVAAVTEIFPLTAVKMHLPLGSVMMAYSVGFVLFYLISYLLCGYAFKNYQFGLVILMLNLLFITDTFYWMLSELMLGMTLMMVFFAMLNTPRFASLSIRSLALCMLLIPVLAFSHPLLFIPFSFCILFLLLSKRTVSKQVLFTAMGIFIVVTIIQKAFFSDGYDSGAAQGIKNFVILFPDYFSQYSQKLFLENCVKKYFWIPLLSIPLFIFYARHKYWKKLVLFSVYLIGYIMLINISYPTAGTPVFYFENLYTPLGIIIGMPFVVDILPALEMRKMSVIVILVIILSGLARIFYYHTPYTNRIVWLREFLQQHAHEKLLIDKSKIPVDTLMMVWGSPYEIWLLSTIEQQQTASLIISDNAAGLEWARYTGNAWMSTWGLFPYSELPKNYFIFKDSTSNYNAIY